MKLLVVEDDRLLNNTLCYNLSAAGYTVDAAMTKSAADDLCKAQDYDLIVLDVNLPDGNGFELCRKIKERRPDTAVIFLTANDMESDMLKGFELGADDYLAKPFAIPELLARVETVLRRYHKAEGILKVFDITIDTASRLVMRDGQQIALTLKEFDLLLLLARNRNIALYRETIYESVWGGEYEGQSRTIDLHVQRLKKKLGWNEEITAVYKVGYRLEGEA